LEVSLRFDNKIGALFKGTNRKQRAVLKVSDFDSRVYMISRNAIALLKRRETYSWRKRTEEPSYWNFSQNHEYLNNFNYWKLY
jgi:hypothetical protein